MSKVVKGKIKIATSLEAREQALLHLKENIEYLKDFIIRKSGNKVTLRNPSRSWDYISLTEEGFEYDAHYNDKMKDYAQMAADTAIGVEMMNQAGIYDYTLGFDTELREVTFEANLD